MPQTKEQHQNFPGQYFIIRFMGPGARQRLNEEVTESALPVTVTDAATGKAYVDDKGEIRTVSKIRFTTTQKLKRLLEWFGGWCNEAGEPVIDIGDGPVKFDPENFDGIRDVLLDERLSVTREEDVDETDSSGQPVKDDRGEVKKKKESVTRTWLYVLSEKAVLRKTFIADPPSTTSASS